MARRQVPPRAPGSTARPVRGEVVRSKRAILAGAIAAAVLGGWIWANPAGRFGLSRFGVTTYSRLPIPILDMQVRQDGALRVLFKTHDINSARLTWLLSGKAPAVLIVGLGWDEASRLSKDFRPPTGTTVVALPTEAALALFNSLRNEGVRVAIHVHSTC